MHAHARAHACVIVTHAENARACKHTHASTHTHTHALTHIRTHLHMGAHSQHTVQLSKAAGQEGLLCLEHRACPVGFFCRRATCDSYEGWTVLCVCVCVCVCSRVCVCVCVCVCMCLYKNASEHGRDVYLFTASSCTCNYIHICIHTHIHTHACTASSYTYTNTRTHAHYSSDDPTLKLLQLLPPYALPRGSCTPASQQRSTTSCHMERRLPACGMHGPAHTLTTAWAGCSTRAASASCARSASATAML
jgi:hypothetical protein